MREVGLFDELQEKLLRGGIAPWRVQRYLAELDDHLADLTENELAAGYAPEDAAMRARIVLGNDSDLADAWLAELSLKSFTARAPWAVFGIVPPFAMLAGFVLMTLLWTGIGLAGGALGPHHHGVPAWFHTVSAALPVTANFSVAPLTAVLLTLLAWRQRTHPIWPLLAAIIMAVLGMRLQIVVAPHAIQAGVGLAMPGPRFLGRPLPFDGPIYAVQILLTLLPAAWLCVAHQVNRAPSQA